MTNMGHHIQIHTEEVINIVEKISMEVVARMTNMVIEIEMITEANHMAVEAMEEDQVSMTKILRLSDPQVKWLGQMVM